MYKQHQSLGFTLIELMVVVAIMGVLATLAVPSFQDRVIRTQVGEGIGLVEFAKQAVASYYTKTHRMPTDNAAAGLPPAQNIVGNYVSSVAVRNGAIHITYAQQSNRNLLNKVVTLRPAVVEGYPQVPIAWVCGTSTVPEKMKAMGENRTNLPNHFLPLDCRSLGGTAK